MTTRTTAVRIGRIDREADMLGWVWEILRYVAAWGGTGLIIWFWYWMFSNIGTF